MHKLNPSSVLSSVSPASNDLAERAVKTVKAGVKKQKGPLRSQTCKIPVQVLRDTSSHYGSGTSRATHGAEAENTPGPVVPNSERQGTKESEGSEKT